MGAFAETGLSATLSLRKQYDSRSLYELQDGLSILPCEYNEAVQDVQTEF